MRKFIALLAALALLPALFACGRPAAPEPLDLAAFAESPMAFDLTDLARFLTPPQLADLEAALREDLAARGLEDYTALYFADPPAGCVKIPFANESGTDLSRLNTEQLARHIAGQVVEAFEGKGVDVGTSTANTTTTKATTVSVTTNTTTTQSQTTTTKLVIPNTLRLSDLDSNKINTLTKSNYLFTDLVEAEEPKIARYNNAEGDWIILRAQCDKNRYSQDGLIVHIYLDRNSNGIYEFIQTVQNNGKPDTSDMFVTGLSLDKGELRLVDNNTRFQSNDTITLSMRNPNGRTNQSVDISISHTGPYASVPSYSGHVFWKFNGTAFVQA